MIYTLWVYCRWQANNTWRCIHKTNAEKVISNWFSFCKFNLPKKKQNKIEPSTQNRTMLLNKSKMKKGLSKWYIFHYGKGKDKQSNRCTCWHTIYYITTCSLSRNSNWDVLEIAPCRGILWRSSKSFGCPNNTDFGFPILVNYPFFMRHFMKESFTEKQNRTIKFYKMLILICIFLIQRKTEESSTI